MIGLFKGLHATISHLFTRKVTVQYPEERRQPPERSRGLLRMRLHEDGHEPRCISCTFCEQVCPSTAIKVFYEEAEPGKVWTLNAGAGPMLCHVTGGEEAAGDGGWERDAVGGNGGAAPRGVCLASSLLEAETLTPALLARTAARDGLQLSRAYGVATFYEQLGPGAPERAVEPPTPPEGRVAEDCPAVLLGNHGQVDPESIDDYLERDGYQAAVRAMTEMTPDEVLAQVEAAGLRGRGGGGRETALKWRRLQEVEAPRKYIVVNASEGDPGSFKDRSLLENNPHGIIEGMIIAGYATGARRGVVYVCDDHALAAERIRRAAAQARERDLLGSEGFPFSVEVVKVPRAFIGGQETALIATLESRRPMPSVRPPYPAEKGFRGMPTLVENPETLAAVPWIIANGGEAYAALGTEIAPGTKLYTLSGAVGAPGLYEATMDYSLKRLVTEAAGGFTAEPRAALVGGPGGGFLSPGLFDIPLVFDAMLEAGGDLGAGTIEVLGPEDCVVDKVRECLAFSMDSSCGKCTPCRLGLRRLHEMVAAACMGTVPADAMATARDLARDIADSAFCGLGRGAVNPLLTALKFFEDEFTDHLEERRCRAGKCSLK